MKILFGIIFFISLCSFFNRVIAENDKSRCTLEDQIAVEVTVYNDNIGLIKDIRKIDLPVDEGELQFMDVASHIMPETVHVRSINNPGGLTVYEQNYEYDLMSAEKLLDKYVGKKVKIMVTNEYHDRKEVIDATLLSNNDGQIYKIQEEIFLGHPGIKVLPGIPENLVSQPTLTWLYANRNEAYHNLEVSYLTSNINWKADYVMVLNGDDTLSDISGWVTLDNKSGTTYRKAKLKLIAGDIHRTEVRGKEMLLSASAVKMVADSQFEEKPFFAYHIYDLQRKTSIKDKQTKQINLLEANGVKIRKEFIVRGTKRYYTANYSEQLTKEDVHVYIYCRNTKENNLGMPLPAGIMRLYKQDDEESLQFIGEDRINHIPKDEEMELKVGNAYDIVAERRQTDYKQITTKLYESEWEIVLRNHKEGTVTVGIIESLSGNWSMVKNSHPYKKEDAFTVRFDVEVPGGGETRVAYRIKVGL
ncbi:MAG: hypothetical protein MRJ65_07355 [Candidatus Brocadiaceae bacterium]|nr:hypothetical protein [Candidatus Brocadiaceae bacterium]